MPALSYTSRLKRSGVAGVQQMVASVVGVNSGDTVDFAADFAKVAIAAMIGVSSSVPAIYTGVGIAGTVVTLAAAGPNQPASLVKDDVDLVIVGPSATT